MSSKAKNPSGAAAFLDYLNRPKVAATNAESVYFATPNNAARELLSQDFLDNPVIYPPRSVLDRSETFDAISPRTVKRINTFMSRIVP